MDKIPKIQQIIKIEPFKITCLWNIGEIRVSDFEADIDPIVLYENSMPLASYRLVLAAVA